MTRILCALLVCSLTTSAMAEEASTASTERVKVAVDKLDALAAKTLESTGVPGIAIAVVHRDQVVLKKAWGVREAGKPQRIDADTVFQLASVSKPIATSVLATVVGEGRVGWDDRVIDHDPAFRMYDPYVTRELTLRDLLCHRSGLPDHSGDLLEDLGFDRQEVIWRLRFQPPDSSFRSQYAYNNFGFSEAGYASAKAVGESWENLADQKLFVPLGMKNTSYRFEDYPKAENRALLHVRVDGKWTAKHTRQANAQAPAGGASSTLNDLVRWMRLLTNEGKVDGKQLVAAEALAETHSPQIVTNFDQDRGRIGSYGLGWIVSVERGGKIFWKHSGEFALGVRTEVAVLPTEKLAIIVLSNAAPTGLPEGLVESFFDYVVFQNLQRDWVEFANRIFEEEGKKERAKERDYSRLPKTPLPPLPLTSYTGTYANDLFGKLEVADKQGKLVMRLGPQPLEFELRHWDRDTFIYQPIGENAGGLSGLRFSIDPGRQADRVLIENLNIHGQGTFQRTK